MNGAAALDHVPPDVLAWFKITGVHMELKALREVLEGNSERLMAHLFAGYKAMWCAPNPQTSNLLLLLYNL